jgi:hypothetical protein
MCTYLQIQSIPFTSSLYHLHKSDGRVDALGDLRHGSAYLLGGLALTETVTEFAIAGERSEARTKRVSDP